jgi:hypothetical protein
MARRVGDPVEVRIAGDQDVTPMSFLWRGRLYVVRGVLGHWRERREWWAGPAARALHGDSGAPRTGGEPAAGGPVLTLDREREVWRVEAGAGRTFGTGVYDLSRELPEESSEESTSDPSDPPGAWRLLRVAD